VSGSVIGSWALAMMVVGWTAIVGLGWATLIRPRSPLMERLALGYLLGLALIVATMLGWQLSGHAYARAPLFIISALIACAPIVPLVILGRKKQGTPQESMPSPLPFASSADRSLVSAGLSWLFKVAIGIVVVVNLAVATYQPTLRWDELSHHMLAAKIFFHEGGVTRESGMLTQDVRTYPPFVPLSRTWLYELTGSDDPSPNHLVSWAMFASFLALFYARLRDFASSTTSLLFTFIASLLMFWGGTESLIDFPLITYGGLGVLTAASALKRRDVQLSLVAGLLLGVAGLVRPDGLSFGLMNLGLFGVVALLTIRHWKAATMMIVAVAGLVIAFSPWVIFKTMFWEAAVSRDTYLGGGFGEMVLAAMARGSIDLNTLVRVVSFVFPEYNQTYGYVLLLAILLIPLGLPDRPPNLYLAAALLMNAVVYLIALYAFLLAGRTDLALREETAVRFGTRLLPLLVFTIGASPLVDDVIRRVVSWRPRRSGELKAANA
jgi:hypothetical protein